MKISDYKAVIRKALRIKAFALATGIAFMGAGNIFGMGAMQSASFGATGAVLGLIGVLLFNFAAKDGISDQDFDSAINQAIQSVQSKTKVADDDK